MALRTRTDALYCDAHLNGYEFNTESYRVPSDGPNGYNSDMPDSVYTHDRYNPFMHEFYVHNMHMVEDQPALNMHQFDMFETLKDGTELCNISCTPTSRRRRPASSATTASWTRSHTFWCRHNYD